MKIKYTIGALLLMTGMALGQSQFSGGGNGNGGTATLSFFGNTQNPLTVLTDPTSIVDTAGGKLEFSSTGVVVSDSAGDACGFTTASDQTSCVDAAGDEMFLGGGVTNWEIENFAGSAFIDNPISTAKVTVHGTGIDISDNTGTVMDGQGSAPTGGSEGAGTLNAKGLYVNGVAVSTGASGTVSSGTATEIGYYSSTGSTISPDASFTDTGSSLTYTGVNGFFTPGVTTNGVGAGNLGISEGITVPGSVMAANSFNFSGQNTITEQQAVIPSTPGTGLLYGLLASPATLVAVMSGGALSSVTISSGGGSPNQYVVAPTVEVSGGGCTVEPAVTTTLTSGVVSGYTIATAGSGCSGTPTLSVVPQVAWTYDSTIPSAAFGAANMASVCATDTGAANAYVIAPTPALPGSGAPPTNALVCFTPAHNSTGASTLQVNSTTAEAITFNGVSALTSTATLTAGSLYYLQFDGTEWQLMTPVSGWVSSTAGSSQAVARYTGARNLGPASMNDNGTFAWGGNGTVLTSTTTISASTLTSTGLVLPTVPVSNTVRGNCHIVWAQATAAATVAFGAGVAAAPTHLYIEPAQIWNGLAYGAGLYENITTNSNTTITNAITPAAFATFYNIDFNFVLITGASNTGVVTIYGSTSNTSDSLMIEPGSFCEWQI